MLEDKNFIDVASDVVSDAFDEVKTAYVVFNLCKGLYRSFRSRSAAGVANEHVRASPERRKAKNRRK